MSFKDRFAKMRKEKNSILCVGVDPALPRQRKGATIPEKYMKIGDENEVRLNFCLDIIDMVKDYAVAIKPNQQYIFGFTKGQHQKLTRYIRENAMLSILDYKLGDISDTVASAIFHISESGYDAITFNPLAGNLKETVELAHENAKSLRGYELGIIVLTLMSNPEAVTFMKGAKIGRLPLFKFISKQVKEFDADGCVVGATGHVTEEDIKAIRKIVGRDKVLLIPGIGAQKGDVNKVLKSAGENILINVGRDIIYSENPKRKSEEYHKMLSSH
ncbi:MAG: orotidine 5'-phosphate decarboxylase [Candidatus Bathycorpusculaceae bacterium]